MSCAYENKPCFGGRHCGNAFPTLARFDYYGTSRHVVGKEG
jgi:hypothetical protein